MIRSISKKILQGVAGVSTALVLLLPLAIIVDVLSRTFFNNPLPVVFEGTQYAMLWIPLLAVPLITLYNEHIVVDLIDGLFEKKHGEVLRNILQVTGAALSLVVVGILAIMAWDSIISTFESGTRVNSTLAPPRWIINMILPASMTLTVIVFGYLLLTAVGKFSLKARAKNSAPITPESEAKS